MAESLIQERLRRGGPITFAAFMEMALYEPGAGYYVAGEPGLDYYTGPAAHPTFGALLGLQLDQMWRLLGCFLANELWDAFPVHRITMRKGKLREAYVALEGNRLMEVYDEPSTPELQRYLDREGIALAEGQGAEINLELPRHLAEVAEVLERGFLISIDYGYLAHERLLRPGGSLRCFYRHRVHSNPYARVGEQDITCSVDFTAAMRAAQMAGLAALGLIPQGPFLRNLGLDVTLKRLASSGLPSPEYHAEAMALRELARPGEMGDFKTLILGKGIEGMELDCFHRDNPTVHGLETMGEALPLPRLMPEHAQLLQARYPHLAWMPPEEVG